MSRAVSGVAIKLSQVSRVRSLMIPSMAIAPANNVTRKTSGVVMNRRYRLNSVRARSAGGLTSGAGHQEPDHQVPLRSLGAGDPRTVAVAPDLDQGGTGEEESEDT